MEMRSVKASLLSRIFQVPLWKGVDLYDHISGIGYCTHYSGDCSCDCVPRWRNCILADIRRCHCGNHHYRLDRKAFSQKEKGLRAQGPFPFEIRVKNISYYGKKNNNISDYKRRLYMFTTIVSLIGLGTAIGLIDVIQTLEHNAD